MNRDDWYNLGMRYRLILSALTFVAALCNPCAKPVWAQGSPAPGSLTQYRINEFAAACQTCEMAFSGVKGSPKPGESAAQFEQRVEGYAAAVDKLIVQVRPLRPGYSPRDTHPDNLTLWKRVEKDAGLLQPIPESIRAALRGYKHGGKLGNLGSRLMEAFLTAQSLLNTLRDARP